MIASLSTIETMYSKIRGKLVFTTRNLLLQGIPDSVPEDITAICRSRLLTAVNDLLDKGHLKDIKITIMTESYGRDATSDAVTRNTGSSRAADEPRIEERAQQYQGRLPLFTFEQLILPDHTQSDLLAAIGVIQMEKIVFVEWGLQEIEPFPRTALNFHGPPGTGKTLAAHAIAHKLGRPILTASYAEIESKFHGDGPKNVKAIFHAAERDNAVLFIDEADSLLSKRLTNVTQASEQAINSMRSQLLICLEQFRGVVIFATNLVENYDKAFETRVRHICFPMPDAKCRRELWRKHLPSSLPLSMDVSIDYLASYADDICGRDIKNAVIDAAVRAARSAKGYVELHDLLSAVAGIKAARVSAIGRKPSDEETKVISEKIRQTFSS